MLNATTHMNLNNIMPSESNARHKKVHTAQLINVTDIDGMAALAKGYWEMES